ncbi:MAG: EAL domain-containing protein [Gammaproteobacteria bacterium]|nr:EAL domain-containing protein [Gammaproteobacteria bacterium]
MDTKKTNQSLLSDPDLHLKLYNELPASSVLIDEHLNIVSINKFGCQQLGFEQSDLLNQPISQIYREADLVFILENLKTILNDKKPQTRRWEGTRIRKDNSPLWVKDTAKLIPLSELNNPYILLLSEDITETRYLINELEKQSSSDALTGLTNRNKFERFIAQTILAAQTSLHKNHGLCYIDLDRFSSINEISGHLAGDELLKQITHLIQAEIRQHDILSRLDGDKFCLLLTDCNTEETQQVLSKILSKISSLDFRWEKERYNISACAGFATIDHTTKNAIEIIKRAGTACYLAKKEGQNNLHFYNPNDKELMQHDQRQKNISLLKWAFENNRLQLHYQEIHAISASNKHKHLEILIRLVNENDQLVYPNDFIPAAEHYGQATKLDLWVTRTALMNFNKQNLTQKIVCNINLSGETLGSNEFIETATKLLKTYTNPNVTVCFEVTETATIGNMNKAIHFINHFKALGCLFALDDFGSGFSSFAYLKTLPIDYLKIDGYFIKNILHDPKGLALVRAMHQVAEIFEIQTVAEFIEDETIMTLLKGIGIDYGQGYHLHKPEKL